MSAMTERVAVSRVVRDPPSEAAADTTLEDDVSSSSEDWTQWEFVDVSAKTGKARTPIFGSVDRTLSDSLVKVDLESSQLKDNLDEEKEHVEEGDLHAQYIRQQREMQMKRSQIGVAWQMYQSTYGTQANDEVADSRDVNQDKDDEDDDDVDADELAALEDATAEAAAELEAVNDEKAKAKQDLDRLRAELAEMEQRADEMAAAAARAKKEKLLSEKTESKDDDWSSPLLSFAMTAESLDLSVDSPKVRSDSDVGLLPTAVVESSEEVPCSSVKKASSKSSQSSSSSSSSASVSDGSSSSERSCYPRMWSKQDWKGLFTFNSHLTGPLIKMDAGESKECGWVLSKQKRHSSGLELMLVLEKVKQTHTSMMDGVKGSVLEKQVSSGMVLKDEGRLTHYSLAKDESELYIMTTVTAPQTPGQYCGSFRLNLASSSDDTQVGPLLTLTILVKSQYGASKERKIQKLLSVFDLDCEKYRDRVVAALVGQRWNVEAAAEVLGSSLLT